MKENAGGRNAWIWSLLLFGGTLLVATTVRAQTGATYSNKNLRGTYVFKTLGWNRGSSGSAALGDSLGPFNALGSLTADGAGNLTGNETINIMYNSNGTPTTASACADNSTTPTVAICVNTLTGTYTINADGSGNWTIIKTPIPGSDCRCGGATTQFAILLEGGPHEVSDSVLFATQSSDITASGQADRRKKRNSATQSN